MTTEQQIAKLEAERKRYAAEIEWIDRELRRLRHQPCMAERVFETLGFC